MSEKDGLLRNLALGREALLRSVEGLSEDLMKEPGAGGPAWSPQDVLGHIAAWERETVEALRAFWQGSTPYRMAGFDSLADRDRWSEEAVEQRRNWPVHETLVELGIVRSQLLLLLADLTEAQLNDSIMYPWGTYGIVSALLATGADHEREHAASLTAWREEAAREPILRPTAYHA